MLTQDRRKCYTIEQSTINLLNISSRAYTITDYHGYIQPNWVKKQITYRLQVITLNCKKGFTGILPVQVEEIGTNKTSINNINLYFSNGISNINTFTWSIGNSTTLRITIKSKNSSITYISAPFIVILPNHTFIYERELF